MFLRLSNVVAAFVSLLHLSSPSFVSSFDVSGSTITTSVGTPLEIYHINRSPHYVDNSGGCDGREIVTQRRLPPPSMTGNQRRRRRRRHGGPTFRLHAKTKLRPSSSSQEEDDDSNDDTQKRKLQFELSQYRSAVEEAIKRREEAERRVYQMEKEEEARVTMQKKNEDDKANIARLREERESIESRLSSLLLLRNETETTYTNDLTNLTESRSSTAAMFQNQISLLQNQTEQARNQLDQMDTGDDVEKELSFKIQDVMAQTEDVIKGLKEGIWFEKRSFDRRKRDLEQELAEARVELREVTGGMGSLQVEVVRLEEKLEIVTKECEVKEQKVRMELERLREERARRKSEVKSRRRRLFGAYESMVNKVRGRNSIQMEELVQKLDGEVEVLVRELDEANSLVDREGKEAVERLKRETREEFEGTRWKLRSKVRGMMEKLGSRKVRQLKADKIKGMEGVEKRGQSEIDVLVKGKEQILNKIRKSKEDKLQEIRTRELKKYKEYELKMTNRLIELKGDVDDLKGVLEEKEALMQQYEEDKESLRKILGMVVKVGMGHSWRIRKRMIKKLLG